MDPSQLDRMCEQAGIALRYVDVWGKEHVASDATRRALLEAMGFAPDDPAAARPRITPQAVIRRAGSTDAAVEIDVHPADDASSLRWRLTLESGERHDGSCEGAAPSPDRSTGALPIRCIEMPADLPLGYHRLTILDARKRDQVVATMQFIVCPARCWEPARGTRHFGPAIQLYALRSRRNWGIGDFTDLARLAALAAAEGASFIGLNPLHEPFLDRPAQASPYSPSTRLALNPLYLDVEAIEDYAESESVRAVVAATAFQQRLEVLRSTPLVDYPGVAAAKLDVLRRLFAHFREHHLEPMTPRGRAMRTFGAAHYGFANDAALFDALQATISRRDASAWGWPAWPEAYRERHASVVGDFAEQQRDDVDFFLYLQWEADRQLGRAADAARDAGMPIGLYRDLAVGANPGGAETWQSREHFAQGVYVGAPPDVLGPLGQNWGLPPWIPRRIIDAGFAPWIALLRANMRHCGGLRIDHVMGLMRLFWIPEGMAPAQGTYVHYPLEDLLAVLALESARNGALVVGEDLGTVPDEVRVALKANGVHSYRVLYFERTQSGEFLAPHAYPEQALVTISTHDLPTLQGYWQGVDIAAREALGLFPDEQVRDSQQAERSLDRSRLFQALQREGMARPPDASAAPLRFEHVCGVHAMAARAPCALMSLQLEDVFGETEQVNLPGTSEDAFPNWRRKVALELEQWSADGRFANVCAAIRGEGRGAPAQSVSAATVAASGT